MILIQIIAMNRMYKIESHLYLLAEYLKEDPLLKIGKTNLINKKINFKLNFNKIDIFLLIFINTIFIIYSRIICWLF